jgi:hypothetical protein
MRDNSEAVSKSWLRVQSSAELFLFNQIDFFSTLSRNRSQKLKCRLEDEEIFEFDGCGSDG